MVDINLTFVTRKDENGKDMPIENKRKIFISYKKSDNLYGIRDRMVSYVLSCFDCAVWYDDSLTPGVDYDREISEAINASDMVVLLLTKNILESSYVWDIEIKQAFAEKKGIIPVLLGIGQESLGEIERRLGHLQLLDGNSLLDSQTTNDEKQRFVKHLERAIQQFFLKQDLAMRVSSFFAAKKHLLPAKNLSVEQLYYMSFGFLNGLGVHEDSTEAVKIMRSLLQLYTKDEETDEFKAEIYTTLIKHSINTGDFDSANTYIRGIDDYKHAPLYYYVGSLYEGILENDPELASQYYLRGAELNHLDSLNAIARLFLRWRGISDYRRYLMALPYLVKAKELGGTRELMNLIVAHWNYDKTLANRKAVYELLVGDGENRHIAEFLEPLIHSQSYLRSFGAYGHSEVPPQERLGEIELDGHRFYLYRARLNERNNNVLLFRDDRVIYEFSCWAYGFGDIDSFDLYAEKGYIVVKCADFCHYDGETNISEYTFLNPRSDPVLVCHHSFDAKPGRMILKYPAY